MRTRQAGVASITVTTGTAVALLTCALLSGCSDSAKGEPAVDPSGIAAPIAAEPRAQLSGLVAAAKDRRYSATYTLSNAGKPNRAVAVTVAKDGTWRVDIQGGALGGGADVAIAGRPDGQYQCALGRLSGCVKVAAPGKKLPAAIDPRVHYPFVLWLDVLIDRQVPLSVAPSETLPGASGACFNVEPAVTALQPPIDPGVFCYNDGVLTAARLPFGTLLLAAKPLDAPPTITLPGPITTTPPLATTAPPPSPSATASPTATVSPSPSRSR